MYAASLMFVVAAVVTLVIGFVRGGLALLFVSIGASALAAVLLAFGVLRRPRESTGPPPGGRPL